MLPKDSEVLGLLMGNESLLASLPCSHACTGDKHPQAKAVDLPSASWRSMHSCQDVLIE